MRKELIEDPEAKKIDLKTIKVTGYYGELFCPDAMLYVDENNKFVLKIELDMVYRSGSMTELLCEIDDLIRKKLTVSEY